MRQLEGEAMFTETQWDHEVDVVCLGAEGGVLAAGIVASNAGFDVFLGVIGIGRRRRRPGRIVGLQGRRRRRRRGTSPASTTHSGEAAAHTASGPYAPSKTSRHRARAAAAPSNRSSAQRSSSGHTDARRRRNGLVYNRVTKRQMTEMRSTRGEKVEAAIVGSVELSPGLPALSMSTWLRATAAEADLLPETDVRLVKLVFEDDGVAGALIETQDGVLAVRARENLIIGVGDAQATAHIRSSAPPSR